MPDVKLYTRTPLLYLYSLLVSVYCSFFLQGGSITHNHPVVIEWSKACDSISKFKESLITLLEEYQLKTPQLASFVEELRSIELPTLDQ